MMPVRGAAWERMKRLERRTSGEAGQWLRWGRAIASGRRSVLIVPVFLLATVSSGCPRAMAPLVAPGQSAVALSGGPNTSMIYLARTTQGLVAIDLGWWDNSRMVHRALGSLGATAADVRWVFLTHSHRDHIAAWPTFRHARFHVGGPEKPRLMGAAPHAGWIPRWAERIMPARHPNAGDLEVHTLAGDTAIIVGADTVRAYLVPGHTAGSVVYLFRGVLFLGDAVTYSRRGGFAPAKRGFSDDRPAAVESLDHLWARLPRGVVRYACTAHAHCAPFDDRFLDDVAR